MIFNNSALFRLNSYTMFFQADDEDNSVSVKPAKRPAQR